MPVFDKIDRPEISRIQYINKAWALSPALGWKAEDETAKHIAPYVQMHVDGLITCAELLDRLLLELTTMGHAYLDTPNGRLTDWANKHAKN